MNAERLHRILLELQKEYEVKFVLVKLNDVRNHLQNQVNQPQQPTHQQNLVAELKNLKEILENSDTNSFSPGWNQVVDEIGGTNLFGNNLLERIESIFESNQITPAAALQEINQIVELSQSLKEAIDNVVDGFYKLKIGSDNLEQGECELGYSIPRIYVENKLSSLNKEISELNFILNNISEVVSGEKQEFEVKTISSSNFLLFVVVGLSVADVLSRAVERIINNYKTILEIKLLRNQLKEKGVPEKETKGIEEHANNSMKEEIKSIASDIIKDYYKGKDAGRKNELSNGITIAFNKLANRIDNGFNVEIRVAPLPEPTSTEDLTETDKEKHQIIETIASRVKKMEFINTSGDRILKLEEGESQKKKD
ncbi:MAG: hypothetical protein KAX69_02105 [Chitinophagales bacterium]|nr:hypothetical protein [Chitinophagales bacterium]